MKRRFGWLVLPFVLSAAEAGSMPAETPPADLVVRNGKLTTGDPERPEAQAAAVAAGRFVAVGDDAEVSRWIGPTTRVIDAGGRRVVPGLTDSHLHFLRGGFRFRYEVRADGVRTLEEILERVRARASAVPAGTWILVTGGWHWSHLEEGRMPTREELDRIAPGHPVNVQAQYDVAQMNSAAIRASGIEGVEIPEGVTVERDGEGRFTGVVREFEGMRFLETRIPPSTRDEKVEGLRGLMAHLSSLGVTSVIEAGGGGVTSEDYQALFELWRQGGMTVRVAVRYQTPDHAEALPWIIATPGRLGDEWMRVLGLGEHLNRTVGGGVAEQTPESLVDLEKSVRAAAANHLSVHQHSVETETVANILDVIERVDSAYPVRDLRFALIHGEGVTRELLLRMKALGMGFGADTRWMIFKKGLHPQFIPDAPPLRTALDMGLPVTFGSDGMIAGPIHPFMWLYSVVTGRNWLGEVVRPNERLTREEALDAITRGAAWFSFDEALKGTIAPGRLGDFVVLDRDYFAVPEEQIGEIRPVTTVVGGRVVYESAGAPAGQCRGRRSEVP